VGGLHVGAAVSGTVWYLAFVVLLMYQASQGDRTVSTANIVVSCALVTLFVAMVAMALPPIRARAHDVFEVTHRFCGWAALVLVWVNTTLFVSTHRNGGSVATALLSAPTMWLLVLTTASSALPWLRLRTVERPSSHVALVTMDHGVTPFIGSVRAISRNPLLGWHAFANVPAPGRFPGKYRMIISRAGDWTRSFIDEPPSHVWVRGIPTAGMANVRKIFTKVLYVATGSGIGPMLGHLLVNEVEAHLLWVTRSPRKTYGAALVDEILSTLPDTTIWNTDERGKPDMVKLAYALYVACGAEAVICVANKAVTWQVVHGLERIGIPAFGPIWDS
jgi:predicted ferric reductase